MEPSILISACLLGEACRYDGKSVPCPAAVALAERREVVPICPEVMGGLPTPRIPSELEPNGRVVNARGRDVTNAFERGAQAVAALAKERGCTKAVLKSRSPSCGVREVYDGSFGGNLMPGQGVTAKALRAIGVELYDEHTAPWDSL